MSSIYSDRKANTAAVVYECALLSQQTGEKGIVTFWQGTPSKLQFHVIPRYLYYSNLRGEDGQSENVVRIQCNVASASAMI